MLNHPAQRVARALFPAQRAARALLPAHSGASGCDPIAWPAAARHGEWRPSTLHVDGFSSVLLDGDRGFAVRFKAVGFERGNT